MDTNEKKERECKLCESSENQGDMLICGICKVCFHKSCINIMDKYLFSWWTCPKCKRCKNIMWVTIYINAKDFHTEPALQNKILLRYASANNLYIKDTIYDNGEDIEIKPTGRIMVIKGEKDIMFEGEFIYVPPNYNI